MYKFSLSTKYNVLSKTIVNGEGNEVINDVFWQTSS